MDWKSPDGSLKGACIIYKGSFAKAVFLMPPEGHIIYCYYYANFSHNNNSNILWYIPEKILCIFSTGNYSDKIQIWTRLQFEIFALNGKVSFSNVFLMDSQVRNCGTESMLTIFFPHSNAWNALQMEKHSPFLSWFWKICNSFLPSAMRSIFLFPFISRCPGSMHFRAYTWCQEHSGEQGPDQ